MPSATSLNLEKKIEQARKELASSWPEILEYVPTLPNTGAETASNLSSKHESEETAISQEEQLEVIEQLKALAVLPPASLDVAPAAALARQLGFAINASVSFSIANQQLLYSYGRIQLQLSQGTINSLWSTPKEANFALYVSPRHLDSLSLTTTPWFLGKRVLVINATQMIGVVAQIAGVQTSAIRRAQFSASSPLIQAGQFWQPGNQGRVIVCFLDDALIEGSVIDLTQGGRR